MCPILVDITCSCGQKLILQRTSPVVDATIDVIDRCEMHRLFEFQHHAYMDVYTSVHEPMVIVHPFSAPGCIDCIVVPVFVIIFGLVIALVFVFALVSKTCTATIASDESLFMSSSIAFHEQRRFAHQPLLATSRVS